MNTILQSAFSEFGEVDEVRIPCDQYTLKPRGFVYVTFYSNGAAEAALRKGSCKVMGKQFLRIIMIRDGC